MGSRILGPVPERPISANPGLKFCSTFYIYFPMHCLHCKVTFCVILTISQSKGSTEFVSLSSKFEDKNPVLKIWLNLGLNFTLFRRNRAVGFWIWNTAQGTRNPTNDWNPESKFHWKRIQNPESGIRNSWRDNQIPGLVLDSLTSTYTSI